MEYTNLNYFLFKMSNLFNGKLFMIAVALIIVSGATLFFVYDYKHNGPVLARSDENVNQEGKRSKKFSRKTEFLYALVPVLLLVTLFGSKVALSHVPAPDTIVPNTYEKNTIKGKVLWVHNKTGKVAITTKDRGNDNPIVATVNNFPVNPDAPLISSYAGTTLTNEQFLTLNVGDNVKIDVHPYKWKYKNHNQYGDDKHASDVMKMLNIANVNGVVTKSKADVTNKKTSEIKPQSIVYSNDLE